MARARKSKHRLDGQPVTRSLAARAAWERSGAGPHGKSRKAKRRADRVALRKGEDS